MQANPILATQTRGATVEAVHRGVVSLVDEKGDEIFSRGDSSLRCYPRSTLKFFQVMPLLLEGGQETFQFTSEEIAVMCASHNAEEKHIKAVESIFRKTGIDRKALRCGAQLPSRYEDKKRVLSNGGDTHDIHNNCSGKHAGFLAYCKLKNLPLEGYLDYDHPLQQAIRNVLESYFEVSIQESDYGVDGCSAPNYAMPVRNIAIGFKNLTMTQADNNMEKVRNQVIHSLQDAPFHVAGTSRYCSELITHTNGRMLGKVGASGVYGVCSLDRKIGLAVKIEGGSMGVQYNVVQSVLQAKELVNESEAKSLEGFYRTPVNNWQKTTVGEIKPEDTF